MRMKTNTQQTHCQNIKSYQKSRKKVTHINTSNIRTYTKELQINLCRPCKFIKIPVPQIPELQPKFQAYATESSKLSYDASTKLVSLTKQQFLNMHQKSQINVSIAQHQLKSYEIPKLVKLNFQSVYRVNLWYYPGNRVTNYHYDAHDNFLYVLQGKKIVYLRMPKSLKCQSIFGVNGNQSIQKNKRPHKRVVVKKGECLFIPCGWFHKVYSVGKPVIAVNYWGNSVSQLPANKEQTKSQMQLQKFLQQKMKQNMYLQQRKDRIMKANIQQLKQLDIKTPFDYQILSRKLEQNAEQMETIWTFVDYNTFEKQKRQMREKMFYVYLQTII